MDTLDHKSREDFLLLVHKDTFCSYVFYTAPFPNSGDNLIMSMEEEAEADHHASVIEIHGADEMKELYFRNNRNDGLKNLQW